MNKILAELICVKNKRIRVGFGEPGFLLRVKNKYNVLNINELQAFRLIA